MYASGHMILHTHTDIHTHVEPIKNFWQMNQKFWELQ